jgi:cytochrome c oxidase assembly factor CtaG
LDSVAIAVLESWKVDFRVLGVLGALAWLYMRGWRQLHRQMPEHFPFWRLVAFLGGLTAIFAALASPLDAFGVLLLQAHMVQHLLLIMAAPPLLWLGQPVLALLRGLPPTVLKRGLGPFLSCLTARRIGRCITHPLVCWLALCSTVVAWHLPALYELGLRSQSWHEVEHACFLVAAMLFWWPVVQVWPGQSSWPRWMMVPYLLLADLVNTALSAVLSFSDHVLYPTYELAPRLWGISAIEDQAAAAQSCGCLDRSRSSCRLSF